MRHFFLAMLTCCGLLLLDACSKNSLADTLTPAATTTTSAKLINTVAANVADLPQAALDYIAANYPNTTILKVEKGFETDINAAAFGVHLSNGFELIFDLTGKFIELESGHGGDDHHDDGDSTDVDNDHHDDSDSTDVDDDHHDDSDSTDVDDNDDDNIALPAAAQTWLDANFPGAKVDDVKTEMLCDGTALLSVEVKQGQVKTELAFAPDGTFLFKSTKMLYADLPQAVKDAVSTALPGGTPKNKARFYEYASGSNRYEVEVKTANQDWEILVAADGTVICQEKED